MVTNPLNFQDWSGMSDEKYGYGALRAGFRNHVPSHVRFDGRASSTVWMGLPDHFPGALEGSYKSLFTMVETDRVPDGWLPFLGEFDQVIVPCEANVRVFKKLHPNVKKVPLGVDRDVYFPASFVPNTRFRFHCGGSLWKRKGLDLVLEAFLRLGVDAELHIKCAPHMMDMPKVSAREDIIVHREWMPEWELANWFRKADCFVAPSRGEGWGLFGLQSIACGTPTILSDTSGHREYHHLATVVVPTYPVDAPDGGVWDETSPDVLADVMLNVYENALKARSDAMRQVPGTYAFSWENASQRLLEAIPEGTLLDNEAKFVPCQPLVTVRVHHQCRPNVAGKQYYFTPCVKYEVPVNVRDVLRESGYLSD